MKADDELLSATAVRLASAERSQLGPHPTTAQMQGYLEGKLEPDAQSELQEHLSVCAVCARELLQLEDFLFGEVAEADLRETSERWPSVRSRLVAEGLLPGAVNERRRKGRLTWSVFQRPVSVNWALAGLTAILLVTTLYLGFQVRASRSPRVNVFITDLIPATASPTLRGDSSPEDIIVPEQADRVLLTLNVPPTDSYPNYVLEIRDGETTGKLRWSTEIRNRTRSGNFNLDIERSFLPEGTYSLRIFGISGDHRELLGEYNVRILHKG